MPITNKALELVDASDLQTLLENEVPEGKTIDYKEALSGNSDKDRKEFLYDISSFANTSGGHLIFGIKEDGGIPTDIWGASHFGRKTEEVDKEKQWRSN